VFFWDQILATWQERKGKCENNPEIIFKKIKIKMNQNHHITL
jgi:hypothetical protein